MLTFEEVVNQSYTFLYTRNYPNLPTECDVAEDVVDNYPEYQDTDLSTPEKYNEWVCIVRQELIRQQVAFREERSL